MYMYISGGSRNSSRVVLSCINACEIFDHAPLVEATPTSLPWTWTRLPKQPGNAQVFTPQASVLDIIWSEIHGRWSFLDLRAVLNVAVLPDVHWNLWTSLEPRVVPSGTTPGSATVYVFVKTLFVDMCQIVLCSSLTKFLGANVAKIPTI